MKKRKINFIKLGILLFGITFVLQNCEKEEINFTIPTNAKFNIKTVSVENAKNHFLAYQKSKSERTTSFLSRESGEELILTPLWETISQDSLSNTDALMTNAQTLVNRRGNYITKLFFIEVNDSIISGLHTKYIDSSFEDGSVKDGRIYFNDLDGNYLDAYKITEGIISHRMIYEQQVQQASFASFLFLLLQTSTISENPCWNTDNLPSDNNLDEVDLGTIESGNGSGSGDGFDITSYWLYTNNNDDDPNNDYQYYGDNDTGSSGGGTVTTSQICPGDKIRLVLNGPCVCRTGKVETSTGECIDNPCPSSQSYNSQTGDCDCKPGFVKDSNGNCVEPTPCERIQTQLNSLPFSISLNDLKTKTSLHQETGYIQNSDATFTAVTNVSNNGHSLDLGTIGTSIGFMHTHLNNFLNGKFHPITGDPEEIQPIRMFTPKDVLVFLGMLKKTLYNGNETSEIYGMMVSSTGTYSLRYTGNPIDIPNIWDEKALKESYKIYFGKYSSRERAFLKFIKHEMGLNNIHLYKIQNNGVIKEKKLKSNERVESIPCE